MAYCWITWSKVSVGSSLSLVIRDAKSQLNTGQKLGIGGVWSCKYGVGLRPGLKLWDCLREYG